MLFFSDIFQGILLFRHPQCAEQVLVLGVVVILLCYFNNSLPVEEKNFQQMNNNNYILKFHCNLYRLRSVNRSAVFIVHRKKIP